MDRLADIKFRAQITFDKVNKGRSTGVEVTDSEGRLLRSSAGVSFGSEWACVVTGSGAGKA